MTAESFLEPKTVLDSVKRQYIGNISGPEKNISFINISAIYPDWLHSLGTRSAGKGTGDFEWCRQTMDELSVFGTSRTSNELKSEP